MAKRPKDQADTHDQPPPPPLVPPLVIVVLLLGLFLLLALVVVVALLRKDLDATGVALALISLIGGLGGGAILRTVGGRSGPSSGGEQ